LSAPSIRRVGAVVLRHAYLLRGSPARIVPLFAWVAVDIVLWGFLTRYLNTVAGASFDFVPVLLGAVLLWDFFGRVMHGVAMAFFEDVWSRNFLNVFASPLSVPEYVLGLVASSIATSLVGLAAMLLLATLAFGLSFLSYGLALLPFLVTLFAFGIALGIVSVAVVLRLGPAAEWLIWPVPALLAPFVGVFYPVATLPGWMRAVSYALPPSYVFEGMRSVVAGGAVRVADLAMALGLCAVYLALSAWAFTHVFRHATREGLIARYSAETAG
jgi:ABC-2 type transport system permease protein